MQYLLISVKRQRTYRRGLRAPKLATGAMSTQTYKCLPPNIDLHDFIECDAVPRADHSAVWCALTHAPPSGAPSRACRRSRGRR